MDILKMIEMQRDLDKKIMDKAKVEVYPIQQMKTAYRVELGELLNEWQEFKFWKTNKTINKKDKLLEFADCLAFALSLESNNDFYTEHRYMEFEKDFQSSHYTYDRIDVYSHIERCFEVYPTVIMDTLILGYKLGITWDEMERAYNYKYKINLKRQENGY